MIRQKLARGKSGLYEPSAYKTMCEWVDFLVITCAAKAASRSKHTFAITS